MTTTWQQVLKKDTDTGTSDVAIDPSNPRIVFGGLWQARRLPWTLISQSISAKRRNVHAPTEAGRVFNRQLQLASDLV